jgi:multiple sugar transport system substrate-binding protein
VAARTTARRVLAIAAAVLVAGSGAAACGDAGDKTDAKAELRIWVRKPPGSASEKTDQRLAAQFTSETGIPAKVTALFDDFETKLQQAAAQKHLPDIVINDTDRLGGLVKQGLVREIDKNTVAGQADLTPTSWQAATGADGKIYGVPFSAQSFALFIRKDWRTRLGLPLPKTWADLDAMAKAFTTKDPDGNGKADTYGYVIPGTTKRGYLSWYFANLLWSAGGDFLTGKTGAFAPAIDDPQSLAAVEELKKQFCTDRTVVPGSITAETTQAHPLFESGKGGIYLTGPYNMARFDKNLGQDKYEVVALPAGPGGKSVSLAEGENVYLMAGSANPAGQLKFAEFAVSAEGQTMGMAGDTDGNVVRLPVNAKVDMAAVRKDTRWQLFADIYQSAGRYVPVVPDWTPFRQESADTLNAIVANCGSDPKAELGKLAATFNDELSKQGARA